MVLLVMSGWFARSWRETDTPTSLGKPGLMGRLVRFVKVRVMGSKWR
jgi:hypothetical protein